MPVIAANYPIIPIGFGNQRQGREHSQELQNTSAYFLQLVHANGYRLS